MAAVEGQAALTRAVRERRWQDAIDLAARLLQRGEAGEPPGLVNYAQPLMGKLQRLSSPCLRCRHPA